MDTSGRWPLKVKAQSGSAGKVLQVLTVLTKNFFHGYSPSELVEATGFSPSDITRYVNTLVEEGYAERIQVTKRVRPSTRFAQQAVQILNAMNMAETEVNQLTQRINRKD